LVKPNPIRLRSRQALQMTFFGSGIVPGETNITIYTLSGEKVANCQSSIVNCQSSEIAWNGISDSGDTVPPGIYIYTYSSPKEKGIGKFTVVR